MPTEGEEPGRAKQPRGPEAGKRSVLSEALQSARDGRGAIAFVQRSAAEGPALLPDAEKAIVVDHGLTLLRAVGHPTEVAYPFGVVMQLLDELWHGEEHSSLFAGPGQAAGDLISGKLELQQAEEPATWFPVIRSLMSVVRRLTVRPGDETRAVAVLVGELHAVDRPSLRFLAYLAARVDELPIALVVSGRLDVAVADSEAFDFLRSAAQVRPTPAAAPVPKEDTGGRRAREEVIDLAHMAARASLTGERRTRISELSRRAWDSHTFKDQVLTKPWLTAQLTRALLAVDELELVGEILNDAQQAKLEEVDATARAVATESRAWMLFHQGKLAAALEHGRRGLPDRALPDDVAHSLNALVAACLVHAGRLDEADDALNALDVSNRLDGRVLPLLLETRGPLRLAQRRPADALRDALEARRRSSSADTPSFGPSSWRCIAARAHLALGEKEVARELAQHELEVAKARDVPRRAIGALRVLAVTSAPEAQIEVLAEAVALGEAQPHRLEYLQALVELGAALRRTNQRTMARAVLARAFGMADELGADRIAARAREELAASAGRRAGPVGIGIDALTASERRVGALAASGRSTKEIAAELFVTPKTVEFHLRHIYQKLDIPSSREELMRTMRPPERAAAATNTIDASGSAKS